MATRPPGVVTTERAIERVTKIVRAVCDVVDIPVWVKITGQSENVAALAKAALDGGAEAVSLMGRFLSMIPELDTQAPLLGTNLGTGGGWAFPVTCYWLSKSRAQLGPDAAVIGMNGARSGEDVLRQHWRRWLEKAENRKMTVVIQPGAPRRKRSRVCHSISALPAPTFLNLQ